MVRYQYTVGGVIGKSDNGERTGATSERQYPFTHRTCSPEQEGRSTPHRRGA